MSLKFGQADNKSTATVINFTCTNCGKKDRNKNNINCQCLKPGFFFFFKTCLIIMALNEDSYFLKINMFNNNSYQVKSRHPPLFIPIEG